jgi:thiol-disulfide isomerase/thioredoxin
MVKGFQHFLAWVTAIVRWDWRGQWWLFLKRCFLILGVVLWMTLGAVGQPKPMDAYASVQDDRFDGNIFALYAGNGSLVPPRVTLAQSLQGERPTILTFYIEDSKDCKQFSPKISALQAFYGRVVDILPINIDSIPAQSTYGIDEPGYYYSGQVPQTILFNAAGDKVLDVVGNVEFEPFDDVLREMFNLLPRTESPSLKRRPFNEVNAEMAE